MQKFGFLFILFTYPPAPEIDYFGTGLINRKYSSIILKLAQRYNVQNIFKSYTA